MVKCRVPKCDYFGGNLTRHLQTHVKKGEIRKSDIPHLSSIMSQGKKQRGPREVDHAKKTSTKGRIKKWCPYQNCTKVVTYLSTHLHRKHRLKKGSLELKVMLKEASYTSGYLANFNTCTLTDAWQSVLKDYHAPCTQGKFLQK